MKYILSILLTATTCVALAREAISDTSYIENRTGVFWQVQRQTFADGRIRIEEIPLGSDTSQVVNAVIGPAFQTFSEYAERAAFVQANASRQRHMDRREYWHRKY